MVEAMPIHNQGWCAIALVLGITGSAGGSLQVRDTFEAEGKPKQPVSIPREVLVELRKEDRAQTCLAESKSAKQVPASWYVASAVHLDQDGREDLVVQAANPCLFGANIAPFWVFTRSKGGYELALRVNALRLDVLDSTTNGHRDIETRAIVESRRGVILTFKFNGKKYQRTAEGIVIP
jgi:hypothetical protein